MRPRLAALAVAALALAGCGPEGATNTANLLPLKGTLTKDGSPVPNVELLFEPAGTPGALRAVAVTDDSGEFTPKTLEKDGIAPGKYRVALKTKVKGLKAEFYDDEKSGLSVEAKSGGNLNVTLSK